MQESLPEIEIEIGPTLGTPAFYWFNHLLGCDKSMSVTLLVSKVFDRHFNEVGEEISLTDWMRYIEAQTELRVRTEPYVAFNPSTGQRIEMAVDDGESEILSEGEWTPFLRYRGGELAMAYVDELDDPKNPVRNSIARVAKHFSALILHDAGDEILDW